jgi:flagellin
MTPVKTGVSAATAKLGGWDISKLAATGNSQTYTVNYTDKNGASTTASVTLTLTTTATNAGTISDGTNSTTTAGPATAKNIGDALKTALEAKDDFKSDGSGTFTIAADADGVLTFTANAAGDDKGSITSITDASSSEITAGVSENAYDFASQTVYNPATPTSAKNAVFDINGKKFAFAAQGTTAKSAQSVLGADVNVITLTGASVGNADVSALAAKVTDQTGLSAATVGSTTKLTVKVPDSHALVFQVGAENSDDQRAQLNIESMNAASLGLTDLDISTQSGANAAIDIIKTAIATVSSTRAQLGGLQNELEHTANNLSTMNENLTSAESTIRDVDMTDEYVQYSKNQILSQAANSMLAQANAQPQNVLTLLKG